MNKTTHNQTLNQLKALDFLDNDAIDEGVHSEESSPWFISLFFGFSGILASLFFMGFLTLLLVESDIFDSFIGLFITGTVVSGVGGCLFYNAHIRHSPFWNSLAFALTLTGQAYITFGLLFEGFEQPLSVLLLLLVQLLMTMIIPNFIYRLLSATAALFCVIYLCSYYNIDELSLGLLSLLTILTQLQRYPLLQRVPEQWQVYIEAVISAFGYASAFVLLSVSVYFISAEYRGGFSNNSDTFSYNYYLAQGLLSLASLYAALLILKRYRIQLVSVTGLLILCAITVLGVMSIYVSGLLATSLIIVIAFANSQRILLGLGVTALVSYIFWYYYQLDTSLLLKSASMLIIGMGLLLIRGVLLKRYFDNATKLELDQTPSRERLL